MSIYPVHLKEWFKNDESHWDACKMIVEGAKTCSTCGEKLDTDKAWAMHAAPWGYMSDMVWCSEDCAYKKAQA